MTAQRRWLALTVAGGTAYFLLPPGGVWQAVVMLSMLGSATGLVGFQLLRGRLPREATILFTGLVLYITATTAWLGFPLVAQRSLPFPSFVDFLYFIAYAVFAAFLFTLTQKGRSDDRGLVLDAVIVILGSSALAWRYIIEPALDTPEVMAAARAAAIAYPLIQLVLAGLVVRLDILASLRTSAEIWFALWIGGELVADAAYGLTSAQGSFSFGHPLSLGWLVSYAALGAFALDPEAPLVVTKGADEMRPSVSRRLTVLGLAALAPLVLLVATHALDRDDLVVIGVAAGASFVLVLYRVSRLTVDVMEQRRLSGQLAELADELRAQTFRDPLTGVANRVLLSERLTHALQRRRQRSSDRVAVLVIDLDGFKHVNDTIGHDAGDTLLREVATRIVGSVRPDDTVARPGGDEFAVLLEGADARAAMHAAVRVVEALRRPLDLGTRAVRPVASVGIAVADDDEEEHDAEGLLRHADIAMYAAKSAGGDRWDMYAAERHHAVLERQRLELELRDVAQRGELVLYYQPVFALDTRRVVGCEALVRWQHPERGFLQPASFIPAAEESGAIVALGAWVLEEACRQAVRWAEELPSPVHVSVNLSRRQLRETDLVETVAAVLDRTGVERRSVTLEVTETALMQDADTMIGVLERLKQLGVNLSMDDFGTGYSSLSDLRRLPMDVIKIDRVFVDGIAREQAEWSLTVAILQLAATLEKRTLAEGIETAAQLAHLRALGCEMGQGFLLGRPMPAEDFARFVLAGARTTPEAP